MNDATKFFWENRPTSATQALHDVMTERYRQMVVEGWTAKHDDEHGDGAMAVAAACYALASEPVIQLAKVDFTELWKWTGWAKRWWKPKDTRSNLVRAAALLLAEIERRDRAAADGVPASDKPLEPVAWVSHTSDGKPLIPTFDRAVAESWKAKGGDVRPLVYAPGVAACGVAERVMSDIEAGRSAFRQGKPREGMLNESARIGWDEAAHDSGARACPWQSGQCPVPSNCNSAGRCLNVPRPAGGDAK